MSSCPSKQRKNSIAVLEQGLTQFIMAMINELSGMDLYNAKLVVFECILKQVENLINSSDELFSTEARMLYLKPILNFAQEQANKSFSNKDFVDAENWIQTYNQLRRYME